MHVDYCDTVIIRNHDKNSIFLSSILYVLNFKVNFLFNKRIYKKKLQESFDQQNLYIHNKFKKEMFKTQEREEIYIIKKIVKDLNEFILFSAMYYNSACLININTAFSST